MFVLIMCQKLLIRLLMDLPMKLLIKSKWRGVFWMYLIDFKQKSIALTNYPTLSAILQKNPLFSMGSFCFCRCFVFRMNYRRFRTAVFFRQSVGCRVRRAIINNDDFKIGKRLRQNAVHRFVNERALIIARNSNL